MHLACDWRLRSVIDLCMGRIGVQIQEETSSRCEYSIGNNEQEASVRRPTFGGDCKT
jgi:hypothetical protein